MKVTFDGDIRNNDDDKYVKGVEFEINDDCVFVQIGYQYVRIDRNEFKRAVRVVED